MALHLWSIDRAAARPQPAAAPGGLAYGLVTLCWLLSAGVYIAAKWAQADMPPWALCFWRPTLAGLILLPLVRGHYRQMAQLARTRAAAVLLVGGLGLAMAQGLIYMGLQTTSATNAGLIMALMPIITMVLARIMLKEAMGSGQAIGAAIALAGMLVIICRGDLQVIAKLEFNPGELWIIGAALCFALYSVLLRRMKFDLERLPLLVLLLGAGALTALPFYIWEILHDERTVFDAAGLLALAYVAAPGGALMYYLYNWSVDVFGSARAGVFLYLQTIFIAALAWLLLDERPHIYTLFGTAFIVVGVLLVTLSRLRPPALPAPAQALR